MTDKSTQTTSHEWQYGMSRPDTICLKCGYRRDAPEVATGSQAFAPCLGHYPDAQPTEQAAIKPREDDGLAIIGPYGTIWTDRLFDNAGQAHEYLRRFWGDQKWTPGDWRLVHAQQSITIPAVAGNIPFPLEAP